MKTIVLITSFICGAFAAEETTALPELRTTSSKTVTDIHFYADIGATLYVPTLGIGLRNQYNHVGVDFSVKVPIMILLPIAGKGSISLFYYLNPNSNNQFYGGIGVSGMLPIFGFFPSTKSDFLGPIFTVGKSYKNKNSGTRFWQANLELYPNTRRKYDEIKKEIRPLVSVSYGICF